MTSTIDHIAILVDDLEKASEWYVQSCGGTVTHKQDTYYRVELDNTCIALLLSSHHANKPHIAILVECIEDLPKDKGTYVQHRDGTHGVYVTDPWGNNLEYICYNSKKCKETFLSYRESS